MTQLRTADPLHAEWMTSRCDDSGPPLPGPIPCRGESDEIANDNAQLCRRSGIVIDPMFLN